MATQGKRGQSSGNINSNTSGKTAADKSTSISPDYKGGVSDPLANNKTQQSSTNEVESSRSDNNATQQAPTSTVTNSEQNENVRNNQQPMSTARTMQSQQPTSSSMTDGTPQNRRRLTTDEVVGMLLEDDAPADVPVGVGYAANIGSNERGVIDSLTGEVVDSSPIDQYTQVQSRVSSPEYIADDQSYNSNKRLRKQNDSQEDNNQTQTSSSQTQPLRSSRQQSRKLDPFYEQVINADSLEFINRRMPNSYRFERNEEQNNLTDRELINSRIFNVADTYQGEYVPSSSSTQEQSSQQNFSSLLTDEIQEPRQERRNDRFKRAANQTRDLYISGIVPIESMSIDDNGWISFDNDIKAELMYFCETLNISVPDFMRLLLCRIGLSVDVKGNIMGGESLESWSLAKKDFIKSCNLMRTALSMYGNPLAMIDSKPIIIGGSYRFPVPPPIELCDSLINNDVVNFENAFEFYTACRDEWLNHTQPSLYQTTQNDKQEQREAINNMVRAIHNASTFNADNFESTFNISLEVDRSFQEIVDDNRRAIDTSNGDFRQAFIHREEVIKKAKERTEKRAYKVIKTKDENGNVIYERRPKHNNVGQVFSALASWERFAGILNPVLVVPNVAEHVIGSTEEWIVNNGLLAGKGSENYKMTEGLYNNFLSDDARKALAQLQRIMNAGGADAVTVFANSKYKLTQEDVTKFLNEEVLGRVGSQPSKVLQAINNFTEKGLQGDFLMGRIDAKRFAECTMVNYMNAAKSGYPSMTTAQIEEAFRSEDAAAVIKQIAASGAGTQALVAYRNTSFGRVSPLGEGVKNLMRKNGVTDFLVTTFLCKYVDYGINLIQNITPFSNTISYAAVKGLYDSSNGSIDFTSSQLGGESISTDIQGGLKQCLAYDCAKLGQFGLTTLFLASIMAMMGFDEPDDPELIYNYDEYKIGGTAYKLAWWMNDLVGFGAPLAVAINVLSKFPDDPARAINVFWDGAADILNGTTITQVVDVILNADAQLRSMEQAFLDPEMDQPIDWTTQAQELAWTSIAEVTKDMTPAVLNQLYRDTFFNRFAVAPNAYSVFTYDDPDKPYKTKSITDPVEINNRKLSQNNLIFAGLMNLMNYGQLTVSRDDNTGTGYFPWEQAIRTMKDPVRMAYVNMFSIDYDALKQQGIKKGTPEWDSFVAEQSASLKDFIENNFDSVDEAIANGFTIPADLRSIAIDYYFNQITLNKLDFVERSAAGEYYNWNLSNAAYTRMKAANQEMYDFIYDWLQNDKIPWSDEGYVQLLTDYQVYYRDSLTGEAATWLDWKTNPSRYEQMVKPYGNHPTSYLPVTSVDQANRGYNAETINEWYDSTFTDINSIYDMTNNMQVQYGKDAGTSLSRATLGGYGPLNSASGYTVLEEGGAPTINQRSWITAKDFGLLITPEDIFGKTEDSASQSLSINTADVDDAINEILSGNGGTSGYGGNTNSPGYKYWSSRGGSSYSSSKSSYSPKIYSNSKVLNFDKPATMYSKNPYGATKDYLRPAFYTKGSREAYRRQDM